jgi:hypothetical protein
VWEWAPVLSEYLVVRPGVAKLHNRPLPYSTIHRSLSGTQMPSTKSAKTQRDFDPKKFLAAIGEGRKVGDLSHETENLRARGSCDAQRP